MTTKDTVYYAIGSLAVGLIVGFYVKQKLDKAKLTKIVKEEENFNAIGCWTDRCRARRLARELGYNIPELGM